MVETISVQGPSQACLAMVLALLSIGSTPVRRGITLHSHIPLLHELSLLCELFSTYEWVAGVSSEVLQGVVGPKRDPKENACARLMPAFLMPPGSSLIAHR